MTLHLRWFCYSGIVNFKNTSFLRKHFLIPQKCSHVQLKFFCQKVVKDSAQQQLAKYHHWNMVSYVAGTAVLLFGLSYAAVPLYRMFCQVTGFGGTVRGKHAVDKDKIDTMEVVKDRLLRIRFEADSGSGMAWNFKPLQKEIYVRPGETALAFYSAKNPSNIPIVGISSYNVVPFDAGIYFSKIQCFCFEEQMLNPGEELEMPVFFYIDPDMCNDPKMQFVETIILGYTFFQSDESTRKAMLALQSTYDNNHGSAKESKPVTA